MFLALFLAFVSAMAGSGVGCSAGALVVGTVHFVVGFVLVVASPYRLRADKILAPFAIALIGLTCILKATGNDGLSAASDMMTAFSAVLQILRTIASLWVQLREHQWGDRLQPIARNASESTRGDHFNEVSYVCLQQTNSAAAFVPLEDIYLPFKPSLPVSTGDTPYEDSFSFTRPSWCA